MNFLLFFKKYFQFDKLLFDIIKLLDFIGNHNHAFFVAINFYGAERLI